jgi:hypothetical protein
MHKHIAQITWNIYHPEYQQMIYFGYGSQLYTGNT